MSERYGFRTSFRGFHKQDVLTYVDHLRSEQHDELIVLQDALDRTRKQLQTAIEEQQKVSNQALQEQCDSLNEQIAALTEQVNTVVAENAELKQQVEHLTADAESARQESEQQRQRAEELTAQLEQSQQAVLKLWNDQQQYEAFSEHTNTFVGEMRQLGDQISQTIEAYAQKTTVASTVEGEDIPQQNMERWLF